MRRRILASIALAIAAAAPLRAQQDRVERLAVRVLSTAPLGTVVVDRGERDKVKLGDQVLFFPPQGGTCRGSVTDVAERMAVVALEDKSFVPAPGTRGEVLVPQSRLTGTSRPAEPKAVPAGQDERWKQKDEGYAPGMPLLAQVRPVRPEDRGMRITGRDYLIGDLTHTPNDGLANSFFRAGTDVLYENPFGNGGAVRVNPEVNYRTEQNDQEGFDLLVRRLSYTHGGTRFSETRTEVGRFLQHGMPELGVLDGVEWNKRGEKGERFGVSAGFMPEPDDDFETLEDFQIAAFYEWMADPSETLVISTGVQKTLHRGKSDRDLLLAKVRYLPADGWDFHGAAWVDFYYGRDDVKDSAVELTQAIASVGRRWGDGNRLDLTWVRRLFPEILRTEFTPVAAQQIAEDHNDRLTLSAWAGRFHGLVGAWTDEDDSGGSAEAGIESRDVLLDGSRTDITLFASMGSFTSVVGARLSFGRHSDTGYWDIFYEAANHHQDGFPSDRDDLPQHRLVASKSLWLRGGFDVSIHGAGHLVDGDVSSSIGFFVQRRY